MHLHVGRVPCDVRRRFETLANGVGLVDNTVAILSFYLLPKMLPYC